MDSCRNTKQRFKPMIISFAFGMNSKALAETFSNLWTLIRSIFIENNPQNNGSKNIISLHRTPVCGSIAEPQPQPQPQRRDFITKMKISKEKLIPVIHK